MSTSIDQDHQDPRLRRLSIAGAPAGTFIELGPYEVRAWTPDGAHVGRFLSPAAAVARLEAMHRASSPPAGPVALVLTHPDGTHTLLEYPDAVDAHRVASVAVHRNRDAVHAIVIGPTGCTELEERAR
jgi:hypothetical protein